jgi:DNA-binding NarL/FixJ family response regulator
VEMTIAAMPTTNERPLGTVWIKSTASLLSMGLESALKKRGIHFHRGLRAPQDAAPSVVVFSPEGENELTSGVQDLKEPAPDAAIVVFGASADLSLARAALRAGADGFLHAAMPPEQIARALEKAQDGEVVLPRELLGECVKEMVAKEKGPDLSRLGARKVEVLELMAEGLSNAQIAKRLYISESTVKQHLRLAYKALEVNNRNQAAGLVRRSQSQRWVGRKEEVLEKRLALT